MGDFSANDGSQNKKIKLECSYGERCYRKKPEHFEEFIHSHLNDLLKNMGDKIMIPSSYSPKISKQTIIEQLGMLRKFIGPTPKTTKLQEIPSGTQGASSSLRSSPTPMKNNAGKTIKIGCGKCSESNCGRCRQLESYRKDVLSIIKNSVSAKMEATSPYNIFLTSIKNSPQTHEELLTISFVELLDPYFGELESSLQINFMVELGFLIAQYGIMGYKTKPLTLLYGQCDMELGENFKHFLSHAKVIPPSSFGSHHTKMMVFRYTNGSVRIVVSTANLVESDWVNRTQGLWISPECPALPPDSDTNAGESVTNFKKDFLNYLSAYRLPQLQYWLETLRAVDMSPIKVFLVASVPGSHTTHRQEWGQLKLSKVLSKYVPENDGTVIAQCSSIGSLGPTPSSWLQGEVLNTFTSCIRRGLSSPPQMKLVYPSFKCISESYDGLLGGGCLPYPRATHKKQEWLVAYMCEWYSDKRHRTKAPPHIKTYTRLSKDEQKIYYFVLTSANMSKAAWGMQSKSGSLNILSYEAGVVLLPQFLVSKDYFPLKKENDATKIFPLPYDIPVAPYTYSDVPWFIDNLM